MLLFIMLYVMLAYLMLFAALSNAVCFYNGFLFFLFLQMLSVSCFVLVYFKFDVSSYAVLLICLFLLTCTSGRCNRQSEFTLLHFTIFQ